MESTLILATVSIIDVVDVDNFWTIANDESRRVYEIVNHVVLIGAFCLFGITTNVINILIFCKQGLSSTINISLLGISISDLASLVTLGWLIICVNPFAEKADLPFVPEEVQYLSGGLPHIWFTRTTCMITIYITAERCICIAMPLKVKQIITPARTKCIIMFLFFLTILIVIPEYSTVYFGSKFNPPRNKTLVGLVVRGNRDAVEGFVFLLNAVLGITSFLTVIMFTVILIIKLKQKSKWRKKSTFDRDQSEEISTRDKKTMNMVVLIAVVLIVCFTPTVTFQTVVFFIPEFSVTGRYANTFHIVWSFAFLFEAINSSVNIFLYYNMSSKYKQTFHELFAVFTKKK